ncbi:MAG: tetratricopeptide repeat protein [Burkholderiaceae bacterium]
MKFLRWHAVACFAAALSVTPPVFGSQTTEGESPPPAVELTPRLLFQILGADLALQRGDVRTGWSTYLSLARQTRDPRLARRATEIALEARALQEAIESARLWLELSPNSGGAGQILETLLLAGPKPESAEALVRARLERARQSGELAAAYAQLQRHLSRSSDPAAAWRLMDKLSTADLNLPQARLARAALAGAAGLDNAATLEIREALRIAPADNSVALAAARLLASRPGSREEALSLLGGLLKRDPRNIDAIDLQARVLVALGRDAQALDQFARALELAPQEPGLLLAAGQLAQQLRRSTQARTYLDAYLAQKTPDRREREQAILLRARIAEDEGRPDEALTWLERIPTGPLYLTALTRRATLLVKSGRTEQATALFRAEAAENDDDRVRLISAEAAALREGGQPQRAFEILDQALSTLPDRIDLLYDHGMAAERIDRIDLMEASMRKVIALKPDHAHAHNALGYTLADRNLRLDEARKLIERAVELSPDDGHILDSMGWVLFRLRDQEGALRWLRKAWSLSPDAEVGAHLGEVLWVSGRRTEALEIWRASRSREPDNRTLEETLKRLGASL